VLKLEPRTTSHLYPIADQSYEWNCGTDARGLQVFTYFGLEELTAIFFKSDGTVAEVKKRELPPFAPSSGPGWREAKEASEAAAFDAWKREIGISSGTIRIRRQAVEDLIIEDWPEFFVEFARGDDKTERREENRQRLWDEIERWWREGCYVLWFGKDYWMEGDGTIGST